ncbi:MAG: hydroxyacid dehydrogenase [Anaerolineales bacterium]
MKKVLVNKPIHQSALDRLAQEVDVLTPFTASPEEVLQMLKDVQGVVLCVGLKMTREVIERLPSLEVIGRHGAGLEIVDVEAATHKGIPVVFTPEGPTESTAEHALLLMAAAARKLSYLDRATRSGMFSVRDHVVGCELMGKKVGVVGFGHIGKRFAEMCKAAFQMEIHVFDPFVEATVVEEWGAVYHQDLVEMAQAVHFLSLHCPATPATHHLVNDVVLNALGNKGFLINCARGQIVDERALITALQNNRIAGAGLDVYETEPPAPDHPFFKMDNVVLTPHLASFTEEGRYRMGMMVAEDVLRVLRGEYPLYPANPEIFEQRIEKGAK